MVRLFVYILWYGMKFLSDNSPAYRKYSLRFCKCFITDFQFNNLKFNNICYRWGQMYVQNSLIVLVWAKKHWHNVNKTLLCYMKRFWLVVKYVLKMPAKQLYILLKVLKVLAWSLRDKIWTHNWLICKQVWFMTGSRVVPLPRSFFATSRRVAEIRALCTRVRWF